MSFYFSRSGIFFAGRLADLIAFLRIESNSFRTVRELINSRLQ